MLSVLLLRSSLRHPTLCLSRHFAGQRARGWASSGAVGRGGDSGQPAPARAPRLGDTATAPAPARAASAGLCTNTNRDDSLKKEARESDEDKLSKSQQLKKVFKEYGAVAVVFHIGISLASLGIFYVGVSSGVNVAAILQKVGFSEAVIQSRMAAGTSTFVLAYAAHKLFAPVRVSITLVSVPFIVRYIRKIGLFKGTSHSKP